MDRTQMRTWAEVDMGALEHNYRVLRDRLPAGCRFLGVVKADAYGHGAVAVAKKLAALGCDYLAVACLEEAVELRRADISLPILILGATPCELAGELIRYDLTQTVGDEALALACARAATAADKPIKVHVKVDTGMSRLGFLWEDAVERTAAMAALPGLLLEGIFTHFAVADTDLDFTREQLRRFLTVTEALAARGVCIPIRHCASSAAVLRCPETHLDMVRPGIALYGYGGVEEDWGLCPVLTMKTRVAAVRRLPAGTTVSYGRTVALKEETAVAVLPVGYADGYPRALSNRGAVRLGGVSCPILGRVCMDLCMVSAAGVPDARVGDEVVLYGAGGPDAAQVAELVGTIPYEVLTWVGGRVPRIYL